MAAARIERRALALGVAALTLLPACRKKQGDGGEGDARKLKIAVVPKGTTHEFWKSVHAGAKEAADALGVEMVFKGPLKEDDLKEQIDLVQSFTAQRVSGIVLAPLNDKALRAAVRSASRAKVPVVIIDSALEGDDHVAFVATDNVAAGKLAGERMAELLGGKGRVVVLRYQEGSASTAMRERGFIEAARAAGLTIVSDNQHGGATTETAFATSQSLLLAQGAADGKVDGIFCPNESTSFGMLLALEKAKLAGTIRFVGFDASDKLEKALAAGSIDALVLQHPRKMGKLGVETLVAHLRGEATEAVIDTGARVVDKKSLTDPEIEELLRPKLEPVAD